MLFVVDAGEPTIEVHPPFVVVAERRDNGFRVRARNEPVAGGGAVGTRGQAGLEPPVARALPFEVGPGLRDDEVR